MRKLRHFDFKANLGSGRIQLKGTTMVLILLASFFMLAISVHQAQAVTSLSDSFESNSFNNWTGTVGGASIRTTPTYSGAYVARFTTTSDYSDAYVYRNIGQQTTVDVKVYIQINMLQANWHALYFMGIRDAVNTNIGDVLLYNNNGVRTIMLHSMYPSEAYVSYNFNYQINTWYIVELKFTKSSTAGEYRVYLNGAEIITRTGLNTGGAGTPGMIWIGQRSGGTAGTVYIDNVTVDSSASLPSGTGTTPPPTSPPTSSSQPKMNILTYESSGLYDVSDYSKYGVYPVDYSNVPMSAGGHKWLQIQSQPCIINSDGSLTIVWGWYHSNYQQLLTIINGWIDRGYSVIWEGAIGNFRTVSSTALAAFMQRLNADLHGSIIWINLNEFNGKWNYDDGNFYRWTSWPPPQSDINQFIANMQMARQIRDTYGLWNIKLAFGPSQDASGMPWEIPLDTLKPGLDAGDYYSVTSYWTTETGYPTDADWLRDADQFVAWLVGGSRAVPYAGQFGGYTGASGPAYNKPWIIHELGHKPWGMVSPSIWIQRVLSDLNTQAQFDKLVVFWGQMDYKALAYYAPMYETSTRFGS